MGAPSWAIPYLNKVNNVQVDGFFWKDGTSYPIIGFEQYPSLQMVANNYSCYSNENDIYASSNRTNNFYIIDLFNLQITSSNNVYSINQTVNRTSVRMPDAWGTTYAYLFYMDATSGTQKVAVPQGQTPPYTESINFSVSGTIQEIIEWVSKHFRNVNVYVDDEYWSGINVPSYTSNGGGATHIAKVTGQLKDLSSNLSDILMVSGGGGGGLLSGDTDYSGKEAGGISGSGDNSADQSTGNAFGQGESGTNVSGGGSGLYGGYKGTSSKSGGAGSGYIGNSLLSNKKMVGYNVPTSSADATKTESVNEVSATPISGKPKAGNGFARIKYLSDGIIRFKNAIVFPNDNYEVKGKNTENIYTIGQLKQTFSRNNTWFLIWDTNGYIALQFNASSSWNMKLASGKYIVEGDEREDWLWGMNNAVDPLYPCYLNGSYIGQSWSLEAKTIGDDTYRNDCYTGGTEEHPCIIVSTIAGLEVYKDGVKVMVR